MIHTFRTKQSTSHARRALTALILGATALTPLTLLAQATSTSSGLAWPSKPIRVIVNFPPGGAAVAKSPADGSTLLMSSGGMVSVNPHARLFSTLPISTPFHAARVKRVAWLMKRK